MEGSDLRSRQKGKARKRYEERRRRQRMTAHSDDTLEHVDRGYERRFQLPSLSMSAGIPEPVQNIVRQIGLGLQDLVWYIRNNPLFIRLGLGFAASIVVLYFLFHLVAGGIMPRVYSMGVDLGGMSAEEAQAALTATWVDNYEIRLVINGQIYEKVQPELLGISFDAKETARAASSINLSAIPFGKTVKPVVSVDRLTAQNYLLDLADEVDTPPYSAGYQVGDGEIIGIPGRDGSMVDVTLTLETLDYKLADIVNLGRLEVVTTPLVPDIRDPGIYLEDVYRLVGGVETPTLRGYDPYKNQFFTWPIPLDEYLSWIAASRTGLTLREDAFRPYIGLLNQTLNEGGRNLRYLAADETSNLLRRAIQEGKPDLSLRVRYRDTTYQVVPGDTGFAVSRKTGIPFNLIEEANPDKDMSDLSPGDIIRVPTRDVTMLEQPLPQKRIIVDLSEQYLVAYENNQVVYEWSISSGVEHAPTSPGVYQILNHDEVAYGGSVFYCDDVTVVCGQWEMSWFMGIYEVIPGLVNGFHGSVVLPNGRNLGDDMIGRPVTFGCIMSPDEQAKSLYDWADDGTVVEIISKDYQPYSDLAQVTRERLLERRQQREQDEQADA